MSEVLGRAAATGEPLAAAWVGVPFEAGGGGGTAAESCLDELGVASSAHLNLEEDVRHSYFVLAREALLTRMGKRTHARGACQTSAAPFSGLE